MDNAELQELVALSDSPMKEGSGYWAYCPTHPDGTKHKRAGAGRQGRSLHLSPKGIKCFSGNAGCTGAAILRALRAESAKAPRKGPNPSGNPSGPSRRNAELVRAYEYRDPRSGEALGVKARFEWPDANHPKGRDKDFRWRRASATAWTGGVDLSVMPLWGADKVLEGDPLARIWWVEGEQCVEALHARQELAVCDSRGSSGLSWPAGQLDILHGRDVIIWADNDVPGQKHARAVRDALRDVCTRVHIWEPGRMRDGEDVVDFLAAGRSLEEFEWPNAEVLSPYESSEDGTVAAHRHTNLANVHFRARHIWKGRSVTAVVEIAIARRVLAYSQINVHREDDRSRLARAAHEECGNLLGLAYPLEELKRDLDAFCHGLWEASMTTISMGLTAGADLDQAPSYILRPYLLREGGTVLFGPPGRGKSWMMLLWAVSIDSGSSVLWPIDEQLPTLFLNLERSEERFRQRLRRVNLALGLEATRPLHAIHARGRSLGSILETARSYVLREGIGLVILDSISRAGMGKLKDDDAANRIIDGLTAICPSWGAIGHTPREDETHEYGSIMFQAGQDIGVRLTSERINSRLGIGLEVSKVNDAEPAKQEVLALEFDDFGLSAVSRASGGEFAQVEQAATNQPLHERIAAYLKDGPAQTKAIADALSVNYETVRKTLARFRMFHKLPGTRPVEWALAPRPAVEASRPATVVLDPDKCFCGRTVFGANPDGKLVCEDHMEMEEGLA